MTVPTRTVPSGYSTLGISTNTTLHTGSGSVLRVSVQVAAAAACSIIDSTGTVASAGNTILAIPASTVAGTVYAVDWPYVTGLTVLPGASVTLNVNWTEGNQG